MKSDYFFSLARKRATIHNLDENGDHSALFRKNHSRKISVITQDGKQILANKINKCQWKKNKSHDTEDTTFAEKWHFQ